jgi:hypothetical protein
VNERALRAIEARIRLLEDHDDGTGVADPAVTQEIGALWDSIRESLDAGTAAQPEVAALLALAWLHFHRFAVLAAHADARPSDREDAYLLMSYELSVLQFHTAHLTDLGEPLPAEFAELLREADSAEAAFEAVEIEAGATFNRALDHVKRHTTYHDVDDLEQAVPLLRAVRDLNSRGATLADQSEPLLGFTLRNLFEVTGEKREIDESIEILTHHLDDRKQDHQAMFILAGPLLARYERFGDQRDLLGSIALARDASAVENDSTLQQGSLSLLCISLRLRAALAGHRVDMDEAVAAGRKALELALHDAAREAHITKTNLASALLVRYDHTDRIEDLSEAIALDSECVDELPGDHPDRPLNLSNLGLSLRRRFLETGDERDLAAALTAGREAVELTERTHVSFTAYSTNLSLSLQVAFEHFGVSDLLDEAVTHARNAAAAAPSGYPGAFHHLSVLATALSRRFQQRGVLLDIDEAVATARAATTSVAADHPALGALLASLSSCLLVRFRRTGRPSDLDEAIVSASAAVAGSPLQQSHRSGLYHSLSGALEARFQQSARPDDLTEAIAARRMALELSGSESPGRATEQSRLAWLLASSASTVDSRALDEAVDHAAAAVAAIPISSPIRAGALGTLGWALYVREESVGSKPADLPRAAAALREASAQLAAPARTRLDAAWMLGIVGVSEGLAELALEGFGAAIELLPLVASRALSVDQRMDILAEYAGLASDAAAVAIHANQLERAVELVDAGRSIIWEQALELRTELSELDRVAPGMAARLVELRSLLDSFDPDLAVASAEAAPDRGPSPLRQQRADEAKGTLAREFDALVTKVRQLPNFEHFLRPRPFSELAGRAEDGPVVVLNASNLGCHALIVRNGVTVVPLNVTKAGVDRLVERFAAIANSSSAMRGDGLADRQEMLSILHALWREIAEPVLRATGLCDRSASAQPPRLWWCPTGRLTLLPIHAAGVHQQRGDDWPSAVADVVVSSYATTLRDLRRGQRSAVTTPDPQILAVAMTSTQGADDLTGAEREVEAIARYFPIATRLQSQPTTSGRHADHSVATVERVRAGLRTHDWAHFACHAHQSSDDPLDSSIWLDDGELRLRDIVAEKASADHDLVFLSACETAAGSTRHSDEAIHLAAAMHLAGYVHVVASLWELQDATAVQVADRIYEALSAAPDGAAATAVALHRAIEPARRDPDGDPFVWAAYIHSGP